MLPRASRGLLQYFEEQRIDWNWNILGLIARLSFLFPGSRVVRIMVLEDDPILAMDIELILSGAGHTVFGPTATAADALELAASDPLDLALIDIDLAVGDGSGLAVALLFRWNIPSILLSTLTPDMGADDSMAVAVIAKPFTAEILLESVHSFQAAKAIAGWIGQGTVH